MARVLVTGAAGLVGFHLLARWLEQRNRKVHGCDSFTPYYDVGLKKARCAELESRFGFHVDTVDLCHEESFRAYYERISPEIVVHLAAQPGVRQGISKPHDYVNANFIAFTNVLDMCRRIPPRHLLYASSSSVYGANTVMPWSEEQVTVLPVSFYAATKMANELMAHSFSHLTGVPMTGMRFFTVYGEWGRPDMAPYKFTQAIRSGEPITVFNHGKMTRDFTYVSDIIDALDALVEVVPSLGSGAGCSPVAPHRVVNIGSGRPASISEFIGHIEGAVGARANIVYADKAPGDVVDTFASVERLQALTGFRPKTSLSEGIQRMCRWHLQNVPVRSRS
jgi:UDP-glucuronate 4-epimerase